MAFFLVTKYDGVRAGEGDGMIGGNLGTSLWTLTLSFTPSPSSLSPVVSMVEAVLSLLAARNVARTLSSVIGRTL